jgi:hypothetical protein
MRSRRSSSRWCIPLIAAVAATIVVACGGQSDFGPGGVGGSDGGSSSGSGSGGTVANEDAGPSNPCTDVCPLGTGPYPVPPLCECPALPIDAGPIFIEDATAPCAGLTCPEGSYPTYDGGACGCTWYEEDAGPGGYPDAPYYPEDAPYYYPDAPYYPYDAACPPTACGEGYEATPECQCIACANSCPPGETPNAGCTACAACPDPCPSGFEFGEGCGCKPIGANDAAAPPADAGIYCEIGGYGQCAAGSWCELGVCQDGVTQYGCYCDASGVATCDLTCPPPPPCNIPGLGTCAYGQECTYGSCSDAGAVLSCFCESAGQAYCYTTGCGADAGVIYVDDAG